MDPRYRAPVSWQPTGMRIGELAALRRERVDLLLGTVDVAETAVEVKGIVHVGPPTTKKGRRTMGLPRPVVEELAAHIANHDSDYVFPAPEGGLLRAPGWRQRFWVPAVKAAGWNPSGSTTCAIWSAYGSRRGLAPSRLQTARATPRRPSPSTATGTCCPPMTPLCSRAGRCLRAGRRVSPGRRVT